MLYPRGSSTDATSDDGSDILDTGKDIINKAEDEFKDYLNDTRSSVLESLKNISSYLPINVLYTLTVARNCSNIIKYNRPFYSTIPLILAGVLVVLGIIFGFFGELK